MGADIRAIRGRIRSVESTMHITKAMQLVAASKLRRAGERMEAGRDFAETLTAALVELRRGITDSAYAKPKGDKTLTVVLAGDRGLAGGFNGNVFRAMPESDYVLPIGKKAVELCHRREMALFEGLAFPSIEDITEVDCAEVGRRLASAFASGELGEVRLLYTEYISMISREVSLKTLLPLSNSEGEAEPEPEGPHALVLFEPGQAAILDAVMPLYLSGAIYGAVTESYASELAARQAAMDSATKNAGEMIETLSLSYNRARQSAITQEITEIIGGSAQE